MAERHNRCWVIPTAGRAWERLDSGQVLVLPEGLAEDHRRQRGDGVGSASWSEFSHNHHRQVLAYLRFAPQHAAKAKVLAVDMVKAAPAFFGIPVGLPFNTSVSPTAAHVLARAWLASSDLLAAERRASDRWGSDRRGVSSAGGSATGNAGPVNAGWMSGWRRSEASTLPDVSGQHGWLRRREDCRSLGR